MSYVIIVILFFLGLLTLWVFLFGILLWILAVVYAIKSDPHRIFIVAEDGKYAVYANSDKGLNMAAGFFTSLGAKRVTPVGKEPDVEELYDELVGRYVSTWGSKWKLKKEIKSLMDKGISREEAIRKIYSEGKGEVATA
ncbi:hypothetical protein KEJ34_03120 [Candidatus Bathyarchaeota archaeon]|nr:hypothetical protein [Candidatus Bathyarchaeota archaeon]